MKNYKKNEIEYSLPDDAEIKTFYCHTDKITYSHYVILIVIDHVENYDYYISGIMIKNKLNNTTSTIIIDGAIQYHNHTDELKIEIDKNKFFLSHSAENNWTDIINSL